MEQKYYIVYPKRGEVYLVNFDPTIGKEIKKTRPAVIIQNNVSNRYSPIVIVAAISSCFDNQLYPTEVFIPMPEAGLEQDSVVLLNQIRSIDKQRLIKKLGSLLSETLNRIDRAIQISLGLVNI
jgi:mRNA interferase MazF